VKREERTRRESNPRPLECHAKAEVYGRCATVRNRARNQALASVQAARRARSRTVRPAQYLHTHLSPFARQRFGRPLGPARDQHHRNLIPSNRRKFVRKAQPYARQSLAVVRSAIRWPPPRIRRIATIVEDDPGVVTVVCAAADHEHLIDCRAKVAPSQTPHPIARGITGRSSASSPSSSSSSGGRTCARRRRGVPRRGGSA
jgi:hypothetical protein